MVRSVVAVIAGYLIFAASAVVLFRWTGRDPHAPAEIWFVIVTIVYGLFFATLAGFVAALLGKRFEMEHALAVASLIAALGAASLLAEVKSDAIWTQLAAILIIAPSAMLGGYLRQRQVRRA
ncbi:MAG TPA: hypothetical protein VFA68_05545 [Terriglobales bacterium]|nr:hypothetical protein [Terriglobales bacterium]